MTPIEEVMKCLKELQDEGLIGYIGLSEVNADTLRKAEKVNLVVFHGNSIKNVC